MRTLREPRPRKSRERVDTSERKVTFSWREQRPWRRGRPRSLARRALPAGALPAAAAGALPAGTLPAGAAAPAAGVVPSAAASALAVFTRAIFRWATFGSPSGLFLPPVHFSCSVSMSNRSARVSTLRCRTSELALFKLRSIDIQPPRCESSSICGKEGNYRRPRDSDKSDMNGGHDPEARIFATISRGNAN